MGGGGCLCVSEMSLISEHNFRFQFKNFLLSPYSLVDEACFPYKATKTPCPFKQRGTLMQDGCRPVVQKRTSRYKVGSPGRLQDERDIMFDIIESGPVHGN